MRNSLKQLQSLRQDLESFRPPTGTAKWVKIMKSFRVAGRPRSVSAAIRVVVLSGFIADKGVPEGPLKASAKVAIKSIKQSAAYCEIAWLNQMQLKKYLTEFRANGYTEPTGYEWVEDREKNPFPYESRPSASLWRVIVGSPVP